MNIDINKELFEKLDKISKFKRLPINDIVNSIIHEVASTEDEIYEIFSKTADLKGVIVILSDSNKKIKYMNSFGCEIFNSNSDKIINRNMINEYVPLSERDNIEKMFNALFNREIANITNYECPIIINDQKIEILWNSSLLDFNYLSTELLISIGIDISERKKSEEKLKENEERFSKLFHSSFDGIAILNINNKKILDVNDAFSRITGYERELLLNSTYEETKKYFAENKLKSIDIEKLLKSDEKIYDERLDLLKKDGSTAKCLISISKLEIGGKLHLIIILKDLTSLLEKDFLLNKSKEQYKDLFETELVGIFKARLSDGKIIAANRALATILGYSPEDINNFDDFVNKHNIHNMFEINYEYNKIASLEIEKEIIEKGFVDNKTIKLKSKDGNIKTILLSAKVFYDKDYIECTITNVTNVVESYDNDISNKEKIIQSLRENLGKIETSDYYFHGMIGKSNKMKKIFSIIKSTAKTDANVLITGESGTGKELVANAIHKCSNRNNERFVAINCGAIPENLMESELFGYEKGAFTGSVSRNIGKFEYATSGTIFLDEIGDLSINLQVKLLRVLQERKVTRIGSNKSIDIDIRIIAATNKNLVQMIKDGTFREDLFYRLNVIPIELPSLRERKEDIPILVTHFINRYNSIYKKNISEITEAFYNDLNENDWKGNIRELENYIERQIVFSDSNKLDFRPKREDMNIVKNIFDNSSTELNIKLSLDDYLESIEKRLISNNLKKNNRNIKDTAKSLGIKEKALYYKISKYSL